MPALRKHLVTDKACPRRKEKKKRADKGVGRALEFCTSIEASICEGRMGGPCRPTHHTNLSIAVPGSLNGPSGNHEADMHMPCSAAGRPDDLDLRLGLDR